MMQMPLTSYPHFSQFLQLQHLHQQRYSRNMMSSAHATDIGMLASHRSGTSCSEASTGTPSPSPSPPLSIITENFSSNGHQNTTSKAAKSFTIDAILGIRDREIDKINRDHIPNNFHSRLGLNLSGSRVEVPNNYSNTLDLTTTTLELGTRIDVTRFSASSRDILGFPLPTDLTASSEVPNFGNEIARRNLQNQISTFPNSNSCTTLSEKSPGDGGKKCGGKSKRVRTIFTPEQLERLEAEFERQQYMVGPERLYLAHTLQLTEAQVKVWFQNRRIKWRKQHLEIQQQRLAAIKQQNQREEIEDTDDESGDSNNYSFSTDTNDNPGNGYFKTVESDLENNVGQYRDDVGSFRCENPCDNSKCETSNEEV